MLYRGISADGHINEPPNLWVDNLPEQYKERGPRIIETPNTKGHAWIMEGQNRPAPMGFSSFYFKSSKKFDRANIIESFKNIKDRGVRYDDLFPGSYDAAERVKEMIEGETDAEVIFNGVGTVWTGLKLMPDQELAPRLLQGLQRLDGRVPGRTTPNAWCATPRCRRPGSTTASRSCTEWPTWACARCSSRATRAVTSPTISEVDDRFWAAAVELDMPINVHQQFFFPVGDLGSKVTADGVVDRERRAKSLKLDIGAGEFTSILFNMISSGVFERFPEPEVHRHRELRRVGALLPRALRRVGASATTATGISRSCRASTSTATCRWCTSSTSWVSRSATTSASRTSCGDPTSRTPPAAGRSTTRSASRSLERVGATP